MRRNRRRLPFLFALTASACLASSGAFSQEIVAVLSSETGPYKEALAGLKQELGESVPFFVLSKGEPEIPGSARVVISFGSKAARKSYPAQTALVYAMAPGTEMPAPTAVKICMEADHSLLLKNIKRIHPGLKSLGVLWVSPRFKAYAGELRAAAEALNINIESIAAESSSDIPERLRRLHGEADALWLPPDPLLINAESLPVLTEFSRANKTPLFVPTAGLVEEGATASIAPSFREMGRQAGIAARRMLEGAPQENKIYPANIEVVINKTAAAEIGLPIPEEALRKANKVLP